MAPPKDAYETRLAHKLPNKISMDKPPADTPSKKSLRNQIGPERYHGFLRYVPNNTQVIITAKLTVSAYSRGLDIK